MSILSIGQYVQNILLLGDDMKLRVRDLREDRDLSQKTVAADLLCDQSLYSKYERGERPLPLELADRLADYFGTSVDYLLGRTDVEKPYPPGKHR